MAINPKQCKICGITKVKLRKIWFKNHYHFYICPKCVKKNGGVIQITEAFETNPFQNVIANPKLILKNNTPIILTKNN